ncbi:MAG: ATP-binding protein [Rhodoglobus sp.]|nr:ATP-binding protein [Rhodoglobus sp.]
MSAQGESITSILRIEDALRVGLVVEVSGRTVRVQVDSQKNSTHFTYQGKVIRGVAVGTYLRLLRGPLEIVGRVEGESITENRASQTRASDGNGSAAITTVRRILTIAVIGKFDAEGHFVGGVAELPLISNPAYLLPSREAESLFAFVEEDEPSIELGVLLDNPDERLVVSLDKLVASHIGVFGNTGSGKSNTLASILAKIARRYAKSKKFRRRARFVILDFNGEYLARPDLGRSPIIDDPVLKVDFDLANPVAQRNRIVLPISAMDDSEFWAVLLEATQKTQLPLIRRTIRNARLRQAVMSEAGLREAVIDIIMEMTQDYNSSVERNSPVALIESIQAVFSETLDQEEFDEVAEFLRARVVLNTTTQGFYISEAGGSVWSTSPRFRTLIEEALGTATLPAEALSAVQMFHLRLVLQYHLEIARGYANREYLAPLMKRLETRLPDLETVLEFSDDPQQAAAFTVISMRSLSAELQRVVGILVTKNAYESQRNSPTSAGTYLALVIDEAHNILSRQSANETDQWRDYRLAIFENYIKEGRKFGAFLFISSQRPYDISPTILSQLHNFFLHRLVNARDIEAVEQLIPYLDRVSFEQIPLLPTGVCVVTGLLVERPVLATVALLPKRLRPVSETLRPSKRW